MDVGGPEFQLVAAAATLVAAVATAGHVHGDAALISGPGCASFLVATRRAVGGDG